jgi:acetoin utilization deacetylase AcuC-like enzyme
MIPAHLPIVFNHDYEMDIGAHVFPMDKYRLAFEILKSEGYVHPDWVFAAGPASHAELRRVHTEAFLADFENIRWTPRTMYSELPISAEIVRGFTLMAGGTLRAARLALEHGAALHLGGGFHHAFADHAEGFCYINDIAVAINALRDEGAIKRAAVVDVDLHQGNGTAHIYVNDADVFTVSIHQEELYPIKQESNVDIGLPRFTADEEYLRLLGSVIPSELIEHKPELVVYVAGADPYQEDQLGDLKLTLDGLRRRDRLVAMACREHGWPVVGVLAGGYAFNKNDTARIHAGMGMELAAAWGVRPARV